MDANNTPIDIFLTEVTNQQTLLGRGENDKMVADLSLEAKHVSDAVESYLLNNNIGMFSGVGSNEIMIASETIDVAQCTSYESISGLIDAIGGISEEYKPTATALVGVILERHAKYGKRVLEGQNLSVVKGDIKGDVVGLESLFSSYLVNDFSGVLSNQAGLESFGVGIDTALPDMKVSITVALMRFHTSVLERLMPTVPTSQPYCQYVKNKEFVIDTSTSQQVKVLDLYNNPKIIDNELKLIVPLLNNAPKEMVADGVIKPNVELDIVEASIVVDKPGYDKINITDKIADDAKMASVQIQLCDGVNTEMFKIDIPGDLGRLSMSPNTMNDGNSGERVGNIRYATYLTKGATTLAGTASQILDICGEAEGVKIAVTAKPNVNVISRVVDCMLNFTVTAHHQVDNSLLSPDVIAMVRSVSGEATTQPIGYSLDARFREDNMRKSNKLVRLERQPLAYQIPTAPNLFYDQAISQTNPETNSSNLAKIVSIGKDFRGINITKDVMNIIHNAREMEAQNPLNSFDVGANYVAGDMVKPYVWMSTFSAKPDQTREDADRSGDIKQKFVNFITYVIEQIHSYSKYVQQLPIGSTVTYRCLTTNPVLGGVVGQQHFHTALDGGSWGNNSGVEYKLTLPNGVVLECITTTFDIMKDTILIVPIVKGAPSSNLNFGHNWNYGTIVGSYIQGSGGVCKRMFINSREMVIPVNIIGAMITVTDIAEANFVKEKAAGLPKDK